MPYSPERQLGKPSATKARLTSTSTLKRGTSSSSSARSGVASPLSPDDRSTNWVSDVAALLWNHRDLHEEKNFGAILETIPQVISSHPAYVNGLRKLNDTHFVQITASLKMNP